MQLSYQPVESIIPVEKPWAEKPPYQLPVIPMEDNTTYNTRFLILFKLFISFSNQFTLSQTKIKKLILFDIYKMLQLNILILSIYNIFYLQYIYFNNIFCDLEIRDSNSSYR